MKPTNLKNKTCGDPIGSDCVIWSGKSLNCISLCKGDSVTEVIYKMATELCNIMDSLNISDYDLECLNISSCNPNIKDLIEILISKICALENIPSTDGQPVSSGNCPTECIVNVAECLRSSKTPDTMLLIDYINFIATILCQTVKDISIIKSSLTSLIDRVNKLESSTGGNTDLSITSSCLIGGPTDLKSLVAELENAFCNFVDIVGTNSEINNAVNTQCDLTNEKQLSGAGVMGTISGWIDNPATISDTVVNAWLTICDIRSAVSNILSTCCAPADCSDLIITPIVSYIAGSPTGTFKVIINGTIPLGFIESAVGSSFIFSDGSSTQTYTDNISGFINQSSGSIFSATGLSTTSNITLTINYTFTKPDGGVCNGSKVITIPQPAACPVISFIPDKTSIDTSFTWPSSTNVTLSIYTASDLVNPVNIKNFTSPVANSVLTHSFTGLNASTQYAFVIQPLGGSPCSPQMSTTLALPCIKPMSISNVGFTPFLT